MGYLANQPGTEITLDEEVALSQLADLGAPGEVLTVNPSGTGLEYTPNQSSDEKVKLSASDPTAGYLEDKLEAGTNITLTEDTGALKIGLSFNINDYAKTTSIPRFTYFT